MLAFFGALPVIGQIVTAFTAAVFNAKVELTRIRIGGDRDVAIKLVEAAAQQEHENTTRLGIFASNKILTVLLVLFAIPLVGFEWKVIIYDKMLGLGSTDTITGQVADWAKTVIYFLFGAPTTLALGKLWFGRDKAGE